MTQVQIRSSQQESGINGTTGVTIASTPLSQGLWENNKDQSGSNPSREYLISMFENVGQYQELLGEGKRYWALRDAALHEIGDVVLSAELGSQSDEQFIYEDLKYFRILTNFIDDFLGDLVEQPIEYKSVTFDNFEDLLYDF